MNRTGQPWRYSRAIFSSGVSDSASTAAISPGHSASAALLLQHQRRPPAYRVTQRVAGIVQRRYRLCSSGHNDLDLQ